MKPICERGAAELARQIAAGELNGHSFPTVTIAVTMFCSLARCARLLMNCVFPLP